MNIFATTLNTFGEDVHPVAKYICQTLEHHVSGFTTTDLKDADCIFVNAPAAPPYAFDKEKAKLIVAVNKPIFVFNDGDGYAPDCDNPNGFGQFLRNGDNIRACFYREWWEGYIRPDLPFPLIPLDNVGTLWSKSIKDSFDYPIESKDLFASRGYDLFMSQSIHVQSRKLMYSALKTRDRCFINDRYELTLPIETLLDFQGKSKISIALEGSGIKCTSHNEACMNSVMAMPNLRMHESYPWIDGDNCIRLVYKNEGGEGSFLEPSGRGIIDVEASISKLDSYLGDIDKLYPIYVEGVINAKRYSVKEYYENYLSKKILEHV